MAGALVVVITIQVYIPVARPKMGTMIRRVQDDRFFIQPFFLQLGNQPSQILIQAGTLPKVIRIFLPRVAAGELQILRQNIIRIFFLRSNWALIMPVVVLMVRLYLRYGHEKRFFSGVLIQKFQRVIIDTVRPVAAEINTAVILVKYITVISMGGKLQNIGGPPKAGIPAPQFPGDGSYRMVNGRRLLQFSVRRQMPLSDIGSFVPRFFDIIRQRFNIGRKHDIIAEASGLRGVFSSLE